ncbi:MAG: hypothetical protein CVU51_02915 [Deltaproteobacteria bacterium HGW-Deltaproteobacteria-1]|jgi:hypothetical protein|nr:MAG: hypothetical protein CVU51_02915 [Deltaproteobacteria bacterium HGW-Deltaproteobacteria-1]
MICPKCGTKQEDEKLECTHCGVIFAKLTQEDFAPSIYRPGTPTISDKSAKRPISMIVIILLLLVFIGYYMHNKLEQKRIDNIGPVAEQPIQESTDAATVQRPGFEIQPVARYKIRAKVLSIERYRSGRWSEFSPLDFALGWGPMSDNAITGKLNISQGNRWYHYSWKDTPPIDPALIVRNSANTHLVPADDNIKSSLFKVRKGEIVRLEGYLINVKDSDGGSWRSSLTREDSGANSCELMWVTGVVIE